MKYPTSSNSEKAQALAVIELGPEGPCDLEDLLTHGKMGLRGSDSQEIDLVVEPDCVDNSDDRLDNPKGINRDQQPKSQGNIKLLQDKEKSAKSGEGTVSSLGLPWHQKAVVKWGLFVFVLLMAGIIAAMCHMDFKIKDGDEVNVPPHDPVVLGDAAYQNLSWFSKMRRDVPFAKSPISGAMDSKTEKGADASVEAEYQRIQCTYNICVGHDDVRAEPDKLVKPEEQVTLASDNGLSCSGKRFSWHFTPVNGREKLTSHGRQIHLNNTYSVDNLCRLNFAATNGTTGCYRLHDEDQDVNLCVKRISIDDSPKSGASGLGTYQAPSLLIMVLVTITVMMDFF